MDHDAEQKPIEDGLDAINGQEHVDEETEEHGTHNVDSAGDDIPPSVDHRGGDDSSSGKLFVGGVSWETNEETFTNYFSKYGEITDSVIMMDKLSGRPRGFGFVTFADSAVADKVLEEEHVIDGRAVEVKRTVPREDMQVKGVSKTKKIFVGGIPPSLTEDELKEYFCSYGSIVEQQIMVDHKTGRSRGFGFVTFESEDIVEKIFTEGKTHELGGKQVEIKKAEPKRPGGDHAIDFRPRYSGGAPKSYGGFGSGAASYGGSYSSGGGYGGKTGRGYDGYGGYGGYGDYGGNYSGGSAGFYGGYGYGFGFGGPMYGGAGYGGSGYGTPGGYGGAAGYGGGKGYGSGGGSDGGGGGGGYGRGKGYGSGGAATGRHHPYRR